MKLRIMTEPQQGADYERLRTVAQATEDLGFDAFFRSDHYLKMGDVPGLPGPTDSWATLAGLAVETSRIRLGTLVTAATFRLPGPLAIITGLWATDVGETFSFAGRHYQLTDSPALPKPAQRPRPPVVIGGTGPRRTPRLAARFADEYNAQFHSVRDSAAAFARTREACEAIGRYPDSMIYSVAHTVCCGKDEAEFRRRAAAIGREPEDLRENELGGTPGEVAAKIAEFAEIGAERVYLQVVDLEDLDHLELLASDVSPQV